MTTPGTAGRRSGTATCGTRLSVSQRPTLFGLLALSEETRAEGRTDGARQFAGELVQLGVDVIVSNGLAGSLAAKAATSTMPIIFVGVGDPVVGGFVPNLAQPGGNVTGVTNIPDYACFAKHLALLVEAMPGVTRVALLLYALDPFRAGKIPPVETAARALGIHLHLVDVEP